MATHGRVVGGHYLNATVTTAPIGSDLVVQSGLKWRKLNHEQVAEWEEVTSESRSGTISAVGQAVAGAVLPRFISKTASAAVGATLDATMRPPHTVRIDWADGKQSLVKLPDQLFTHMGLVLKDRRAAGSAPAPASSAAADVALAPATPPTVTEQAFSLVSGLLKDRKAAPPIESTTAGKPDAAEQLVKLASLRDTGVLTEEEFAAKKAELLWRM
jgi:hypothetical protein